MESKLHKVFFKKRVNKINTRKEFFKVSLDEIKREVAKISDVSVKWIDEPEAIKYRLSIEKDRLEEGVE